MSQKAKAAVAEARKYLGYHPDPWRSQPSPIIDCSGLVQYCYKKVGVNLPRITYDQINCGKPVSRKNLQPGDLVFFSGINATSANARISHVGIYIGGGQFIHASNPTRGVVQDDINDSYYSKHYVKARRVIR
jgi:cell wall-associated NlpC family hydrolase